MSFHKQEFHQKYCNQEVTNRLKDDLKNFIFYWTYGELQAVVNNINQLANSDLRLDYHGISPQWINLRNEKSGSNLVTTKGKNEMLTVLNALQQYIMQVEGKQFR